MRRYVISLIVLSLVFALVLSAIGPVSAAKPVAPNIRQMSLEYYASQGKPPSGGSKVYDYYLLIGPKWDFNNGKYQNGVPYVICTTGAPEGADVEIISAFESWDDATTAELFDTPTYNIVDSGTLGDGINQVSWEVWPEPTSGAIAISWISYDDKDYSGGPSVGDELLEVDIMFNALLNWGIDRDGEGRAYTLRQSYDIRNVATHEVGHMVGLDDLYAKAYSELTMYGYGSKGETKKISLEIGDINGTKALYGN